MIVIISEICIEYNQKILNGKKLHFKTNIWYYYRDNYDMKIGICCFDKYTITYLLSISKINLLPGVIKLSIIKIRSMKCHITINSLEESMAINKILETWASNFICQIWSMPPMTEWKYHYFLSPILSLHNNISGLDHKFLSYFHHEWEINYEAVWISEKCVSVLFNIGNGS